MRTNRYLCIIIIGIVIISLLYVFSDNLYEPEVSMQMENRNESFAYGLFEKNFIAITLIFVMIIIMLMLLYVSRLIKRK